MNKIAIIALFAILLAAVGYGIWGRKSKFVIEHLPANQNVSSTGTERSSASSSLSLPALAKTYTIEMSDQGFAPARLTVKTGDAVKFVNRGTKSYWPASDPHPAHTLNPDFDAKRAIGAGGEYQHTFQTAGEYPFHNHLMPSLKGMITVTE